MNTGIQDGYNLAWKLAAALKHGAGETLLATYNEERLPNARRLLQTTDRVFQFGASDEAVVAFFRTRIFPYIANLALNIDAVRNFIFPLISQIGIQYRDSSLSSGGRGFNVKAGDRMPYFEVEGQSIYKHLGEPKFHMLVFSDGMAASVPTAGLNDFVDERTFPLYPKIAHVFGTSRTFTVLLRPDNYIGLISEGSDVDNVRRYLEKALR